MMIDDLPPWLQPLLHKVQPASAYLIIGEEGAGADKLAFALAAKFSGVQDINQHPDILIVRPTPKPKAEKTEGKKPRLSIRIGHIVPRPKDDPVPVTVTEFATLMPMILERRIVLILQCVKMTPEAESALLKTLEEPGGSKMFILRARHAKQLSPTIVSRCQKITTPPPSPEQALAWLKENGGDETDLHYSGGLPLAMQADNDNHTIRTELINELNKGAKADIIAAADLCAKSDDWFECLQKWAADGARIAAGASPRYFPKVKHLRAPLVRWLDLHAKLIKHRRAIFPRSNTCALRSSAGWICTPS